MTMVYVPKKTIDRRTFFRRVVTGAPGMFALGIAGCGSPVRQSGVTRYQAIGDAGTTNVSLTHGNDQAEIIRAAVAQHADSIAEAIQGKQVLIKLNCVRPNREIIGTHKEAVHGVLEALRPLTDRQILIGEATADKVNARGIYEHFGYTDYEDDYNIRFVELNDYPVVYEWILDADMYPRPIRILEPFVDPDVYLISLAKLKTHNCVVATLTQKNVTMGAPQKILDKGINDKSKMHATDNGNNSPKMLNFNLFKVAHSVRPDFCVIDGYEGLEGNGPNEGNAVPSRVALAGNDFVAVDRIGAELMGVEWDNLGYLQYCATAGLGQGDRSKIAIDGPDPAQFVREYRLHENIDWQLTWKDDLILEKIENN